MTSFLSEICKKKDMAIKTNGFSLGFDVPRNRSYPLKKIDFNKPIIISEIKKKSPFSKSLKPNLDIINLARIYLDSGSSAISVQCAEEFGGSLADLIAVKKAFPNAVILRNDFILYKEEIEISYLCGADMVLLSTSIFLNKKDYFKEILLMCKNFSIIPIIEISSEIELNFALEFDISLLSINARNLDTFKLNKFNAINLKQKISPTIKVIFNEVECDFSAYLVSSAGFGGILCGEYILKHNRPSLAISGLRKSFLNGKKDGFYKKFFAKLDSTLIKICGIRNIDESIFVARQNIDMIGFVLFGSTRRIEIPTLKSISKILSKYYPNIIKVGIIKDDKNNLREARNLLEYGIIECLEFNNANTNEANFYAKYNLKKANFAFYPSFEIESLKDLPQDFVAPFYLANIINQNDILDFKMLEKLSKDMLFLSMQSNQTNINFFKKIKIRMLNLSLLDETISIQKDNLERIIRILRSGN
ncbi:MAG: hypothetical protein K2P17_04560 [Helicobacteraceae bacterium]|nr:hypothetical protein [Helicobacteraceae bacterium]